MTEENGDIPELNEMNNITRTKEIKNNCIYLNRPPFIMLHRQLKKQIVKKK